MKNFYFSQLMIAIVGAGLISYLSEAKAVLAFLCGVCLATFNVWVVQFVWARIIQKKSVAWTVFVIVFKYTLLTITLYFVATKEWLPLGWLGLGLGTILLSIFRIKLGAF